MNQWKLMEYADKVTLTKTGANILVTNYNLDRLSNILEEQTTRTDTTTVKNLMNENNQLRRLLGSILISEDIREHIVYDKCAVPEITITYNGNELTATVITTSHNS